MKRSASRCLHLTLLIALFSLSVSTRLRRNQLSPLFLQLMSSRQTISTLNLISSVTTQITARAGFNAYVPRAVVGVGHNVEVGANVVYTDGFGVSQPIEIQPGLKWRFYQNEGQGVAAAVGGMLYAPVTHRGGTDTFLMLYAVVSKKVAGKYGPRLTGGGYALIGRDEGTGARGGVIAAYEQPVAPRVSFVMDWFSGRNRFGYVTPGLSFTTTKRSLLYTGYSIGNQGRRNNALFTYYGITF